MGSSIVEIDVLTENLEFRLSQYRDILTTGARDEGYFRALADSVVRLRWLGICQLLGQTNVSGFFARNVEAARLCKQLFDETKSHVDFAKFGLVSNYLPMLGAYIAGEENLAIQIATYSDRAFQEDYEYQEDYTYGKFFAQWLKFGSRLGSFIDLTLNELEALEESGSARFALISALKIKSSDDFNDAMQQFMNEHEEYYAGIEGTMSLDKEKFTAERAISVEALAWLKIAPAAGLDVRKDYIYTPQILTMAL
ncbi:immunity 49 family protein [Hahella ganghwensis]|uniref:immunity 49 family protein n=1 Tax=Hahella ganghwensis TaxID=286420 RepID=UPI00035CFCFE|nr:immunity 49 family protein [Hahella ganghwensis]